METIIERSLLACPKSNQENSPKENLSGSRRSSFLQTCRQMAGSSSAKLSSLLSSLLAILKRSCKAKILAPLSAKLRPTRERLKAQVAEMIGSLEKGIEAA